MQLFSLTINGEKHHTAEGTTLEGLLDALGVRKSSFVAECNRQVVERSRLAAVSLEPEDRLEIVRFVTGR